MKRVAFFGSKLNYPMAPSNEEAIRLFGYQDHSKNDAQQISLIKMQASVVDIIITIE